jgi:hypothetical protein
VSSLPHRRTPPTDRPDPGAKSRLSLPVALLLVTATVAGFTSPSDQRDVCAKDPDETAQSDAPSSTSPPTATEVDAWVLQLDSNRRAQRLDAEQQLLRAGPAILPFLPEVPSRPQGHPLTRIIDQLERARALAALDPLRLPPSTPTTTSPTVATEIQAFAAVGLTLDASLLSAEQRARPMAPAAPNSTVWDRFAALLATSPMQAKTATNPFHLQLVPGPDSRPLRGVAAGPYWVEVESLGLRPIAGTTDKLARLSITPRTQPGLRGLITFAGVNDLRVTDAHGVALAAFTPGARIEQFWERADVSPPVLFDVRCSAETRGPLSIEGRCDLLVAAALVPFEFNRVFKEPPTRTRPLSRKRAGLEVLLEKVSPLPRQPNQTQPVQTQTVETRCLVTLPPEARLFESHQWAAFPWTVQFVAPQDEGPPRTVSQVGRGEWDLLPEGAVQLTSRFEGIDPAASDWTLKVELPSLIARRAVTFAVELPFAPSAN